MLIVALMYEKYDSFQKSKIVKQSTKLYSGY